MKKNIVAALLIGSAIMCNIVYAQYSATQFLALHGLKGEWKMETKKGFLVEVWKIKDDSTMHNMSYRINASDTIPQETVELKLRNGIITYTSTVADQNNQQPVPFILISTDAGKYIFENKTHDFPQQIFYMLVDMNTLHAGISGNIQNTYREIPFNYKRQQLN